MPQPLRRSYGLLAAIALVACGDEGGGNGVPDDVGDARNDSFDDVTAFDTEPRDVPADTGSADSSDTDADDVRPADIADTAELGDAFDDPDTNAPDSDAPGDAMDAGDSTTDTVDADVPSCPDADHDTVCDELDRCAVNDDLLDDDGDGVANGCDACEGDDTLDGDEDGTADDCDRCPGFDDGVDTDVDGRPDCLDLCPLDDMKVEAGICGCGVADTDSDLDEAPDCLDRCPLDPDKLGAGQCGCGFADSDGDGDAVSDCVDGCPTNALKASPGVCGCTAPDVDSDRDTILDCLDLCPDDAAKRAPGDCGCGTPDVDADGDGGFACHEFCDDDPLKVAPGACGCGVPDVDSDFDRLLDCDDNCPVWANADQADANRDGVGDVCDITSDSDGDGAVDAVDCRVFDPTASPVADELCNGRDDDCNGVIDDDGACPCLRAELDDHIYFYCVSSTSWLAAHDSCRGAGYALVSVDSADEFALIGLLLGGAQAWLGYTDAAEEGVWRWSNGSASSLAMWGVGEPNDQGGEDCAHLRPDGLWNDVACTGLLPGFVCESGCYGPDGDGDGKPDACDRCPSDPLDDLDGDGICGDADACPDVHDQAPADVDGDGTPDACDNDDFDADGVPDRDDSCVSDPLKRSAGACGCGVPDADGDSDGLPNCLDRCPALGSPNNVDADRDGLGDVCDGFTDTDADGFTDADDCHPANPALFPGADEVCNGVDDDCTAATSDAEACGCTQVELDGRTYRLCAGAFTYGEAVDRCRSMAGFDIVSVEDSPENAALIEVFGASHWIGLSDGLMEGVFEWANGSPSPWRNWNDGEPNDSTGEDCTELLANGLWNDVGCGTTHSALCEQGCFGPDDDRDGLLGTCDRCPSDPFNDSDGDGRCAPVDLCPADYDPSNMDWDNNGIGDVCDLSSDADGDRRPDGTELCHFDPAKASSGSCGCGWADLPGCTDTCAITARGAERFLVCWPNRTWDAARIDCAAQGASLATIDDVAQNVRLAALSAARGITSFWIGANDVEIEGIWRWDGDAGSTFANWLPGEPNNQAPEPGEDCAEIDAATGRWNDLPCSSPLPYACRY